jgi:hypothetical protein
VSLGAHKLLSMPYTAFLNFEWVKGLGPAQVLHAAITAACPTARIWFALDQDAADTQRMKSGVEDSAIFVFLATEGTLRKTNVRHEVACAVRAGKPVLVLLDAACGLTLDELLAQAGGYAQANPEGDRAAGRLHLDAAGEAAFAAAARAGACIPFHRDQRLVSETAPALMAALGLNAGVRGSPPPFRMPALRPPAGRQGQFPQKRTLA